MSLRPTGSHRARDLPSSEPAENIELLQETPLGQKESVRWTATELDNGNTVCHESTEDPVRIVSPLLHFSHASDHKKPSPLTKVFTMRSTTSLLALPVLVLILLALSGSYVLAQAPSGVPFLSGFLGNDTIAGNSTAGTNPNNATGKFQISSEGIVANFVPYGAAISNLYIRDSKHIVRDIVLGWDNASYYSIDGQHPYYGAVPGRYANRIKNSSFTIDGETYHVLPNENHGADTLHGGPGGWAWRNWTITAHTTDSITFSLADEDGSQGFPGEVIAYVTYTLTPYEWHIRMTAVSITKSSPIMLSSHTYWNLDGFANPSTATALNHTLSLPYSGQRVGTDSILIPTGEILNIPQYDANDFWSAPKQLGANITAGEKPGPLYGECGFNCTGYDTCFLVNRAAAGPYDWTERGPVATLSSAWSGIQVDVFTDQDALQIYSCDGQNGTLTLKETQGLGEGARPRTVPQYGCVVIEVQDWIDGINNPSWGRQSKQIFGPGDGAYTLSAIYKFSVDGSKSTQLSSG